MRIISRFNDYYDGVQAHGLDKTSVFKRQSESFEGKSDQPLPPHVAFFRDFIAGHLPDTIKTETRTCRSLSAAHGAVLFAGKLYPFAEVRAFPRSAEKSPVVDHVYSLEALNAFFLEHGEDLEKKKRTIYFRREPKKTRKGFFDLRDNTQLVEKATEMGVCILMLRRLDVDHWARVNETVEVNARLASVNFARVVDAWQAYQELQMFFGNIAAPERPTLSITDKDRHQQHGFDEWSFRKLPEQV